MEERDKGLGHSRRKCRKRTLSPQVRAKKVHRPQVQDVDFRSQPPTPAPDSLHALTLKPQAQPSSSSPDLQVQSLTQSPKALTTPSQALDLTQNLAYTPDPTPDCVQQDTQCDVPLMIHGYSMEEYQAIYHSVVDNMLKYKSGRLRPYTLKLGRKIKQCLWERLGCPKITETETPEGLLQVKESVSKELYPPLIDVDISYEPDAWKQFKKKAKLEK